MVVKVLLVLAALVACGVVCKSENSERDLYYQDAIEIPPTSEEIIKLLKDDQGPLTDNRVHAILKVLYRDADSFEMKKRIGNEPLYKYVELGRLQFKSCYNWTYQKLKAMCKKTKIASVRRYCNNSVLQLFDFCMENRAKVRENFDWSQFDRKGAFLKRYYESYVEEGNLNPAELGRNFDKICKKDYVRIEVADAVGFILPPVDEYFDHLGYDSNNMIDYLAARSPDKPIGEYVALARAFNKRCTSVIYDIKGAMYFVKNLKNLGP